jgi:hypothetical protein
MSGSGAYADLLRRRFETACKRLGLAARPQPLDRSHFRLPPKRSGQLDLFDREPES